MKHWIAVTLLLLCAATAIAQAKKEQAAPPKIEALRWMVGEWQTHEEDLLVRMSVRLSDNQQALVYRVWFEKDGSSTQQYNGMYYWHPREKTFKVLQVDRHGTVGEGTYEIDGTKATQLVKTISATGSMELRSQWEIQPKQFHFVAQFRPEGKTEWATALDVTYTKLEN